MLILLVRSVKVLSNVLLFTASKTKPIQCHLTLRESFSRFTWMTMSLLLQFLNRTLPFCQEADVADAMSAMTLVEKVCKPTSSHLPVHSSRIFQIWSPSLYVFSAFVSVFQDEVWFWGQEILDGGRLSVGYVGNTPLSRTLKYIFLK